MSRTSRILASLSIAILVAITAGCGSGSGSGGDGRLVGSISGASGRAADQITVSVDGTSLTTMVAADGTFAIDHVPAGLHTVIARSARQAMAIVAEVGKGETNVGGIGLREAGQISGLVTNKTSHQPIAGARIAVTELVEANTVDTLPHPVRIGRTDGAGSYTITGLPVGDYLVNVGAEGFESASLSLTVSIGTTSPGDAQLNPVVATAKGSMAGTVSIITDGGEKAPLAGVLVRLTNNGDPQPMRPLPDTATTSSGNKIAFWSAPGVPSPVQREFYTFSDENGAYKIDGVPAGSYLAVAVRPGLEPQSKPVTITDSGVTKVDFELKLFQFKAGIVEGIVTDSSTKKPIANANVAVGFRYLPMSYTADASQTRKGRAASFAGPGDSIFIDPGLFTQFAVTDDKGHYQLKVPAGDRTLNVSAQGYQFRSVEITVQAGATLIKDIALDPLQGLVILSGKVTLTGSDGVVKPVAGANVYAGRIDFPYAGGGTSGTSGGTSSGSSGSAIARPSSLDQTTTDANGAYKFSLQAGQYGVSATRDDYFAPPITVDLKSDTTLDLSMKKIVVPPPPNGG